MSEKSIQINTKEVGAYLRTKRTELGFTQQAIADACDISLDTYKKWEQGNRLPPLLELVKLSRFYGCSIESLLLLDEPQGQGAANQARPEEKGNHISQRAETVSGERINEAETVIPEERTDPSASFVSEDLDSSPDGISDPSEQVSAKAGYPPHLVRTLFLAGFGVLVLFLAAWLFSMWFFEYRVRHGYRNELAESASAELLSGETFYYEDGSYITVELVEVNKKPNGTRQAVKTITCYKGEDILWTAALSASFAYSTYMSAGTAADCQVEVQNSKYFLQDKAVSMVGNTAVATFTIFHKVLGITVSATTQVLTLSCDTNGQLT